MSESETGDAEEAEGEETRFEFDVEEILETISDIIKSLQGRFESEDARRKFEQGEYEGPVTLASNEEVVNEAVKKMVSIRQKKKAVEIGEEDEDRINKINVNLDIPETMEKRVALIREFDNILAEVRQPIVEEIEEREKGAEKNPMVQEGDPIMTYIFEKNAGAYGDATIFGGAKALVFNLCEQHGYTEDEQELIRKCHEIAADKNGVERHTLIEDVVIAPQFKHEEL